MKKYCASSKNQKKRLGKRDGICCWYCDKKAYYRDLQLEHRIPLSRGGPSGDHNMVLSCSRCNLIKSDRTDVEFFEWCMEKGMWERLQGPGPQAWLVTLSTPSDEAATADLQV